VTHEAKAPASRLGNFPVSFFSIILGLNGLVIAT